MNSQLDKLLKSNKLYFTAYKMGRTNALQDFSEMIDERIIQYRKLNKQFPKSENFLAKWEAMIELKSQLQSPPYTKRLKNGGSKEDKTPNPELNTIKGHKQGEGLCLCGHHIYIHTGKTTECYAIKDNDNGRPIYCICIKFKQALEVKK